MIVRLLFFVLVFAICWIVYRQFTKAIVGKNKTPAKKNKDTQEEAMVKCAHCGTFVPTSHAIYDQHQTPFCCIEHKQEASR